MATGHLMTIGVLALFVVFIGWVFVGVRRYNRDLSAIKASLTHISEAVQLANRPENTAPEVNVSGVVDQPRQAETINGSQEKSASNIVAFIAAIQAGSSLQEAAQRYDLTEDEALAISISYRDAAPASANNDAMS